jgi:cytochrome c-type biogenesis protein CcmH
MRRSSSSRSRTGGWSSWLLAVLLNLACVLGPGLPAALAVQPDEVLQDPALEARARSISAELRCLVCQNQSIDDSDAPLARDLRLLVREKLTQGASDAQVVAFLVDRYGEFVLLRPSFSVHNMLLWMGPLAILLGGAVVVWVNARGRRAKPAASMLTTAERAALDEVLGSRGEH